MADDLISRVTEKLSHRSGVTTVTMFGSVCFMMGGNMLVCVTRKGDLLARVGAATMEEALGRPGVARMQMNGRTMKDYVIVDGQTLDDDALSSWMERSRRFVDTLPPKAHKTARKPRS